MIFFFAALKTRIHRADPGGVTRAALLSMPPRQLHDLARAACAALRAGGHAAPGRCDQLPRWLLAELVLSAARRRAAC